MACSTALRRGPSTGPTKAGVRAVALWLTLAVGMWLADKAVAAEAVPEIAYEVEIAVPDEPKLEALMEEASLLNELEDQAPASRQALNRRIEADAERFEKILRAQGFYAGKVSYQVSVGDPVHIAFTIEAGPSYLWGAFEVVATGCEGPTCAPVPSEDDLRLELGKRARAKDAIAVREAAVRWFEERGHPTPKPGELDATVDHNLLGMFVRLEIEIGPARRFGEPAFDGAESVKRDYLRRLVTWTPGEPYDVRQIESYHRRLFETGLFESVVVEPAEDDGTGPLPIKATLIAGKPRSIGAGVAYSTAEGPSGRVYWEHRNFFGRDEDVRIAATGSPLRQALDLSLRKPNFRLVDQDLNALFELERERKDAFDQQSATVELGLERKSTPEITTSVGVLTEVAQIDDHTSDRMSYLVGVPVSFTSDHRDDLLDPHKGYQYTLKATPFGGYSDGPVGFARLEASGAYYRPLLGNDKLVLALRGRVGSIPGPDSQTIPATRRFYAGGGASIRGYQFELVGPLDGDNDPLGGRSVVEVGGELRARVFGDFGLVGFVDGGNVYDDIYPSFDEVLRWAAGVGVRYYTPVGPLRFDIAVPINPRSVDDAFQFYISLGQAF